MKKLTIYLGLLQVAVSAFDTKNTHALWDCGVEYHRCIESNTRALAEHRSRLDSLQKQEEQLSHEVAAANERIREHELKLSDVGISIKVASAVENERIFRLEQESSETQKGSHWIDLISRLPQNLDSEMRALYLALTESVRSTSDSIDLILADISHSSGPHNAFLTLMLTDVQKSLNGKSIDDQIVLNQLILLSRSEDCITPQAKELLAMLSESSRSIFRAFCNEFQRNELLEDLKVVAEMSYREILQKKQELELRLTSIQRDLQTLKAEETALRQKITTDQQFTQRDAYTQIVKIHETKLPIAQAISVCEELLSSGCRQKHCTHEDPVGCRGRACTWRSLP